MCRTDFCASPCGLRRQDVGDQHTYDLFYVIRNYGAGIGDVVDKLRPLLDDDEAAKAVDVLRRDFTDPEAVGPRRVAEFVTRGPDDEVQADVVGFVSQFLKLLFHVPQ